MIYRQEEREEEDLMEGGNEFQYVMAERTNDCIAEVWERGIEEFDGW